MKNDSQQHKVVWSSENVTQWLISNGWSSVVDTFHSMKIESRET